MYEICARSTPCTTLPYQKCILLLLVYICVEVLYPQQRVNFTNVFITILNYRKLYLFPCTSVLFGIQLSYLGILWGSKVLIFFQCNNYIARFDSQKYSFAFPVHYDAPTYYSKWTIVRNFSTSMNKLCNEIR